MFTGDRKSGGKSLLVAFFCILLAFVLLVPLFCQSPQKFWNRAARLFGISDFTAAADDASFALFVLDVGKADSILVECGGKTILVDAATADQGNKISSFLKRRGIASLDLVVNTHPDKDHIGGFSQILREFPVGAYWSPEISGELVPDSDEYRETKSALEERGLSEYHPKAGEVLNLGGVFIEVLAPLAPGKSTNDSSLVLRLTFGSTHFLLMGDAEEKEEMELLASGADLSAHVLKVGHHGSKTSTTPNLLEAVSPQYAAISVANDSNGLPRKEVLTGLKQAGAQVYQTDVFGALLFVSDGETVEIVTERN